MGLLTGWRSPPGVRIPTHPGAAFRVAAVPLQPTGTTRNAGSHLTSQGHEAPTRGNQGTGTLPPSRPPTSAMLVPVVGRWRERISGLRTCGSALCRQQPLEIV